MREGGVAKSNLFVFLFSITLLSIKERDYALRLGEH
jgi:hypothetical protein